MAATTNTALPTPDAAPGAQVEPERTRLYLRYCIERGYQERYGHALEDAPAQYREQIEFEYETFVKQGLCSYFLILKRIMDFCRERDIPYGPGRGSVGGSLACYVLGIHEIDPVEWGLIFERFMNPYRVSFPDVDLDFSQERRGEVIDFTRELMSDQGSIVLQVGAFSRAGGRSTVDNVAAAKRQTEGETAESIAFALRSCFPDKGNITGGTKQPKEISWWLEQGHGDKERFRETAETAGWLDDLEELDGMYTGLTRHAAGVVILDPKDARLIPQCSPDGQDMVTGFDMYDLETVGALKYDYLGLRTLDVIAEAHIAIGGSGNTRDLLEVWKEHKDDPDPYPMLAEGDTLGIFQMETSGYRHTLKQFKPDCFEDIVHLNALYRPGALDYEREGDGKNMVDVFIMRRHNEEAATPPAEQLRGILRETNGIFLYQEQAMKAVQILAGFSGVQADELRKGIGKKRQHIIDKLKPEYYAGCEKNGIAQAIATRVWENIEAAARYSWNKSHSVFYAIITWLTAWFKVKHPAAFYGALFNSYGDKEKDRLSEALAEARQRITISPPNINVAKGEFVSIPEENTVVFGLNGIKGFGEATRTAIEREQATRIPFGSFKDFCARMHGPKPDGSTGDLVDIGKKLALIRCGAFDDLDERGYLLATCTKPGKGSECKECGGSGVIGGAESATAVFDCAECDGEGFIPKTWHVAEAVNHNRKLKKARDLPQPWEVAWPTDSQLASGEVETIGFYVTSEPLANVAAALGRVSKANHIGGEVEKIYMKTDKRGMEYPTMTVITPSLNKQRVLIFGSNWPELSWINKGDQLIFRGKMDGGTWIADRAFHIGDMRHFKSIKTRREITDDWSTEPFDNQLETVEALERAGYTVKLL